MGRIYLLKAQSEGADSYEKECSTKGYPCSFLPVLSFEFCNQQALSELFIHQPAEETDAKTKKSVENYGGFIITSQRVVQAIKNCCDEKRIKEWWASIRLSAFLIYAVGEATTARMVRELFGITEEAQERMVVGISASQLASLIIERETRESESGKVESQEREKEGKRNLLYLCGNRRRDELPQALTEGGIPFEELCVYNTVKLSMEGELPWTQQAQLAQQIRIVRRGEESKGELKYDWVCFFSPSGVKVIAKHQKRKQEEKKAEGEQGREGEENGVRYAAIGKTTAAAMQRRGLIPHVIAAAPNAQSLIGGIQAFETSNN